MKTGAVVLLVEDVRSYRTGLVRALKRECEIEAIETEDILHAIRALEQHPEIRVVVADERLPRGGYGTTLLETVGRRWPGKGRLLLSAWTTADMVARGKRDGYAVLDKVNTWAVVTSMICELVAKAA
jgi:DNA-binding NtrC family response regulator